MQSDYATASANGGSLEFLSFRLGNEEYGIDIQKVQELRGYTTVTGLANVPPYIKGVVNLRGLIVPIIDLRIKFNLGEPTYDQFTVVIILNMANSQVGVVVDSVSDVITLSANQVKPVPDMGTDSQADYMTGMGIMDDRMFILVDIDRLLAASELAVVAELAE
jgi:purine-binding chemotaxis protein CheW